MDDTIPTVIKKITEKNSDWTERIGSINEEKDMIIERYEEVLNFLKGVQINPAPWAIITPPNKGPGLIRPLGPSYTA